jgi:hypothetical protein
MDGKVQAHELFDMVHLELALHFFFLRYVDVLKVHMRYVLEDIIDLGTTLSSLILDHSLNSVWSTLDILHFLLQI